MYLFNYISEQFFYVTIYLQMYWTWIPDVNVE